MLLISGLHIHDDACTLARHEVLRSTEARDMLGMKRLGCFEIPLENQDPTSGHDIDECVTLNKQKKREHTRSFIMGHRLQFKVKYHIAKNKVDID